MSKSEQRAQAGLAWVEKECAKLVSVINDIGEPIDGQVRVRFGHLFVTYQDISDTLVGILQRAKKRNLVHFEGEMLFQRRDDDKWVTVLNGLPVPGYHKNEGAAPPMHIGFFSKARQSVRAIFRPSHTHRQTERSNFSNHSNTSSNYSSHNNNNNNNSQQQAFRQQQPRQQQQSVFDIPTTAAPKFGTSASSYQNQSPQSTMENQSAPQPPAPPVFTPKPRGGFLSRLSVSVRRPAAGRTTVMKQREYQEIDKRRHGYAPPPSNFNWVTKTPGGAPPRQQQPQSNFSKPVKPAGGYKPPVRGFAKISARIRKGTVANLKNNFEQRAAPMTPESFQNSRARNAGNNFGSPNYGYGTPRFQRSNSAEEFETPARAQQSTRQRLDNLFGKPSMRRSNSFSSGFGPTFGSSNVRDSFGPPPPPMYQDDDMEDGDDGYNNGSSYGYDDGPNFGSSPAPPSPAFGGGGRSPSFGSGSTGPPKFGSSAPPPGPPSVAPSNNGGFGGGFGGGGGGGFPPPPPAASQPSWSGDDSSSYGGGGVGGQQLYNQGGFSPGGFGGPPAGGGVGGGGGGGDTFGNRNDPFNDLFNGNGGGMYDSRPEGLYGGDFNDPYYDNYGQRRRGLMSRILCRP